MFAFVRGYLVGGGEGEVVVGTDVVEVVGGFVVYVVFVFVFFVFVEFFEVVFGVGVVFDVVVFVFFNVIFVFEGECVVGAFGRDIGSLLWGFVGSGGGFVLFLSWFWEGGVF